MVNDMRKEYDFSKGERGKYFNNDLKLNLPVYLDDEFLSLVQGISKKRKTDVSSIVNQILRSDMYLIFFHFAQFHRAHETADQHATPKQRNIFARLHRSEAGHTWLAEKINDGAADRNFAADIHENGDDTEDNVRMFQRARPALNFAFADVRQMNKKENHRQHHEHDAEREIRHLDRVGTVRAGLGKVLVNQKTTDNRPDGGADGIKTLCQVQPGGSRFLRSKNGDVGIGGDLQHGKTEADDE